MFSVNYFFLLILLNFPNSSYIFLCYILDLLFVHHYNNLTFTGKK